MEKRIFIALPISEKLQTEILNWEKDRLILPVRWLKGYNLHATLVPPWSENDWERVVEKLNEVRDFSSFNMEFHHVSYGPSGQEPRLIWAEGEAPREAVRLKEALEEIFQNKSAYSPWIPHMTLARFNPEDFKNFELQELNEGVHWVETARSVVLMESVRTNIGTDYKVLHEVNLNLSR